MRVLVLGGDGMLGHALLMHWRDRHDVHVTLRQSEAVYRHLGLFPPAISHFGVDVRRVEDVLDVLARVRPEAVVNAVGIVKQRASASDAITSLEVNSLFPHRLAQLCGAAGARLVHVSTDCVFSGAKGRYTEQDEPDARDTYGRTKLLGEVEAPNCLTVRTSIIGLELSGYGSLIEWWLRQRGIAKGFRRALFSGLTTTEMARAIEHFLVKDPGLQGRWHLASQPISKYELLSRLGQRIGRADLELVPDEEFVCDRTLDASALRERTAYRVPSWDAMLDELGAQIEHRRTS